METGYKHSVTIFLTDKNTKVETKIAGPVQGTGSLVNMTMEETFPYKFKDLGDGEYTGLGDAGMSVSFNLTPPNVSQVDNQARGRSRNDNRNKM